MSKFKSLFHIITLLTVTVFSTVGGALEKNISEHTIILNAIGDFIGIGSEHKLWYVDEQRASLAVDAEKYKKKFATVQTTFRGEAGNYALTLTSLVETDGESEYRLSLNNQFVASVSNPEASTDFDLVEHDLGRISLKPGDIISVAFNSATNGKIPEGDGTAYARGRWTKLTLQCITC